MELYNYLESKGKLDQVLDDQGVYKKKAPQEAMEVRLGILEKLCVAREEADQAALKVKISCELISILKLCRVLIAVLGYFWYCKDAHCFTLAAGARYYN